MAIRYLKLQNFKRFRHLELSFQDGMNIVVGANDAGKSTVLEAIHLATSGLLRGRYLRNELSPHLFNNSAVDDYIRSLKTTHPLEPPAMAIELYLNDHAIPELEGNGNSKGEAACGFCLRVAFDDTYRREYESLVKSGEVLSLPIEYYSVQLRSFARDTLTPRTLALKTAMIDSTDISRFNGSDVYISRIVRDILDTAEAVGVAQAFRRMKETFRSDPAIVRVNEKVQQQAKVANGTVTLSADLPSKNDWEDELATFVDQVPFSHIGKGEQSALKTKLAIHHRRAAHASIVLIEEPENHLTHARLNGLLRDINDAIPGKQVIVSTHSSFVANKLGLGNLVLLSSTGTTRFSSLATETREFFEKVSGYDTLRLVLASKAILVEGDSDELVVQKAYANLHAGRLPIEDGIDVISVGTSFLRFLEIAAYLEKPVAVVTDNDGDPSALDSKYSQYLGGQCSRHIKICFDRSVDTGGLCPRGKPFNYNTLEPKLLKANGLEQMNRILGTRHGTVDEMHIHMRANKTDCALKVFTTEEDIAFPQYILDAVL